MRVSVTWASSTQSGFSRLVVAASAVIEDLKSQGYIVQINWVNGFNTEPLDVCEVDRVNIPGDTPASQTTAYVDVSCPNHPDEDSGSFGIGIGIG